MIEESAISPSPGCRPLTFVNGLALVLGLQIGSGIFFAPSQVSNHVPCPGAAVLVWFLAGLLVWTGAASFIELGVAIPNNGGIQEYLRFCYGDYAAFLFSWVWVAISKPGAMALISMIFAQNLFTIGTLNGEVSVWVLKSAAFTGLWVVALINCLGAITGARVANVFLVWKLFAITSIAIIGVITAFQGTHSVPELSTLEWFGQDPDPQRRTLSAWGTAGELVTAIYGALFCYGGWEAVSLQSG